MTRIVDSGGHDSGWRTQHVLIDTLTPTDNTTMSAGWQNQPVDVTVVGTDGDSGIDHVEWQLDNGGQQTRPQQLLRVHIAGDGVHTLLTRVVDVAGNVSGWTTTTVRIDASAPHNTTPTVPNSAWRSTPYTVQLSGDDDVSGLKQMHYKIDNGTDTTGPSGVLRATVSGAGTHTLTTWAEDIAGNMSGPRNETINIDNVVPTDTTSAPSTPVQNNYPVTVNGTDAHSGVNIVKWKVDGGAEQQGANGSVVTIHGANGPHTLHDRRHRQRRQRERLEDDDDHDRPVAGARHHAAYRHHHGRLVLVVREHGVGDGLRDRRRQRRGLPRVPPRRPSRLAGGQPDAGQRLRRRRAPARDARQGPRRQLVGVAPADDQHRHDAAGRQLDAAGRQRVGEYAHVHFERRDPLPGSGVTSIEYKVDGGAVQTLPGNGTVSVVGDGPHTIWHRVLDVAGQASAGITNSFRVDTVAPANTSPAAPTGWQVAPAGVSLTLTGTDALSGVARAEWRVNGGAVTPSWTAALSTDGVQTLETRIVDNAGNASAVAAGDGQARQHGAGQHDAGRLRRVAEHELLRRASRAATRPRASAASSGSSTAARRRRARRSRSPRAARTRWSRGSRTSPGNYSAWRTDAINIDKTAPTLSADCGSDAWRSSPAVCSVSADGGLSGLTSVTAQVGSGGSTDTVTGGAYTIAGDGTHSLTFRAVDGAGNEKLAIATVKIDQTPPGATLSCSPGAGTSYVCAATGSDALSGLAGLAYSVDGGAPIAIATGATFSVDKGTVRGRRHRRGRQCRRGAGDDAEGAHAPKQPTTDKDKTSVKIAARTASHAVLKKGKGSVAHRALGQLDIKALPDSTVATMSPLALGAGTYKIVLKVKADKKTKQSSKTYKAKSGYSPQIVVKGGGAFQVQVSLSVQRKVGARWVAYAAGTVKI